MRAERRGLGCPRPGWRAGVRGVAGVAHWRPGPRRTDLVGGGARMGRGAGQPVPPGSPGRPARGARHRRVAGGVLEVVAARHPRPRPATGSGAGVGGPRPHLRGRRDGGYRRRCAARFVRFGRGAGQDGGTARRGPAAAGGGLRAHRRLAYRARQVLPGGRPISRADAPPRPAAAGSRRSVARDV